MVSNSRVFENICVFFHLQSSIATNTTAGREVGIPFTSLETEEHLASLFDLDVDDDEFDVDIVVS